MLWLFGKVSNQDTIREVRDRIRGNLIAVRLFGDGIALVAKPGITVETPAVRARSVGP